MLALVGTVVSVVALAACGGSGGSGGGSGSKGAGGQVGKLANSTSLNCKNVKTGGALSIGVSQDVVSFDPPYTQDNGSLWADMNVYDQLVQLTPDASKLVPGLATSWTISNGGKTYIFHLRTARFSNGDPITAQDVAFSLERGASPKAFANVGLSNISSAKPINAHTLQVNLNSAIASSAFLNVLALWPASILDEKAFNKVGASVYKNHPVGSGPYTVESFKPGNEVVLKKNPYYWETDSCGHHYPYLNTVTLKYMPNDNTRVTALQGGQLDAMFNVPYNEVASLNSGDITSAVTPQFGVIVLSLSQKVPAFRRTNVVQAINYAIDRAAIVKAVFFGNANPAKSPIDPGVNFFTGKYGYPYDLPKAKQLMKASGFKGFTATLAIPSGDAIASAVADIVQNELKAIGGDIKLQSLDPTTLSNENQQEKLQISYVAGTSDNLDPSANSLFCCVSNGGAHSGYTGWVNPQADALFDKTQTEMNFAKRGQLYDQWQKIILEKGPFVWVVNPTNTFAYHKNVHDLFLQHTAHYPLWVAWKG
ncbi:MAG: ABC transporter substrate-binding protein [Solirubrobacteraceae bacterium]